jgi:SAM-dependent methyltransferase
MNTRYGANSENLKMLDSQAQEIQCIEQVINRQFAGRNINALDVGCGRKWVLRLSMPCTITGIDTDEAALAQRDDLDVALPEDVRTVQLAKNRFDLIYCSYVLEHIEGAEVVLMRFLEWLKPGGLQVLRFPDRNTVFGFITRTTPFWIHVAYKRYLLERKAAGAVGHGPYPTVYDEVVSRKGMRAFCQREGLTVLEEWGRDTTVRRRGKLLWLRKQFVQAVETLSIGKLDSSYNSLVFIIQKPH